MTSDITAAGEHESPFDILADSTDAFRLPDLSAFDAVGDTTAFDAVGAASASMLAAIDRTQRQLGVFAAAGKPAFHNVGPMAEYFRSPWNDAAAIRVVPATGKRALSAAGRAVQKARTVQEFGAALKALRLERGLSLNALKDRLDAAKHWLSKSTLSRVCSGRCLFREREHVIWFVTACGVGHEARLWVQAWERVRTLRDAGTPAEGSATVSSLRQADNGRDARRVDLDGPDNDVLGEIRIQFTRGHVRMAIALLAALGLAATTADTATIQTVGAAALAMAACIALIEQGYPATLTRPPAVE